MNLDDFDDFSFSAFFRLDFDRDRDFLDRFCDLDLDLFLDDFFLDCERERERFFDFLLDLCDLLNNRDDGDLFRDLDLLVRDLDLERRERFDLEGDERDMRTGASLQNTWTRNK